MGRRQARPDRLGEHAPNGVLVQRDRLRAQHLPETGFLERLLEARPGLRERNVV